MLTGALATLVLKEGRQLTLEELSNEEQDGFIEGQFESSCSLCLFRADHFATGRAYSEIENRPK